MGGGSREEEKIFSTLFSTLAHGLGKISDSCGSLQYEGDMRQAFLLAKKSLSNRDFLTVLSSQGQTSAVSWREKFISDVVYYDDAFSSHSNMVFSP